MAVLAAELHPLRLKVSAHAGKYRAQIIEDFLCEYASPVFRHKDPMHMKRKGAVPALPDGIVFNHRPSIIETVKTLCVRIKDKHAKALDALACECNMVWNYVNELSLTHT